MLRQYPIKIYTTYKNQIPKMSFVQHDTEVSKIYFEMFDDIDVPMTNISTATGTVKRPDGNVYTYGSEAFSIEDNFVTFILPPSAVYTSGECSASISVYNSNGSRLSTQTFKYNVTAELVSNTPIDETNEYPVLTKLIEDTTVLKETYVGALQGNLEALNNVEIVNARGTFDSLKERLDDSDDKINAIGTVSPSNNITDNNLIADIKAKTYNVGDKIHSKLHGGSWWEVKSSVSVEIENINFDDELHLVVNLKGGGTAIAECQISSVINYAKSINTKKYVDTFAKLRRRKAVKIACYGDSITFGQYTGQSGAVVKVGTATNFGDGSLYEHNQIPTPYPSYLASALNEIYNSNVTVVNRGYSGDLVGTAYKRHLAFSNQDVCTMLFGINDNLYATSNGTVPDSILNEASPYCLKNFIEAYRKLIVREMLRGSSVVLITPHRHISMVGYDGTAYSSAKLLQNYVNAIIKLGKELDVPVIKGNEFLGNYPKDTVTFDGCHLNDFGCQVMGKRLASIFIGRGYNFAEHIVGERQLTASSMMDSIEGNGSTEIVNQPNSSSFSPPYYNATDGEVINVGNSTAIYYSFYLEEDKKFVMPIGTISSAVLKYEIDFSLTQPEYKLDTDPNSSVGDRIVPLAFNTINSASTVTYLNSIDDIANHICIQGKGWHSVKISLTSGSIFILSGLRFFNYEIQENWKIPTLLNNWVNYGSSYVGAKYYKDSLGIVHLVGWVKNGIADSVIFTLPVGYRPSALTQFITDNSGAFGRFAVNSNGDVSIIGGSASVYLSLNNISFRAEL